METVGAKKGDQVCRMCPQGRVEYAEHFACHCSKYDGERQECVRRIAVLAAAGNAPLLRKALNDTSPDVRIVAAQALAEHGASADLTPALEVLRALTPPEKNGMLVAMSALSAIEALGKKAESLHELVRTMKPSGPTPHARFDSYVPRLIANIAPSVADANSAPAAKGKRKKKAGAAPAPKAQSKPRTRRRGR